MNEPFKFKPGDTAILGDTRNVGVRIVSAHLRPVENETDLNWSDPLPGWQ